MQKFTNTSRHNYAVTIIVIFCVLLFQNAHANDDVYFTVDEIGQWQHKSFEGNTEYLTSKLNDKQAIIANSNHSASALLNKTTIDLESTPYLNWTWQVEALPDTDSDDSTKNGDDYAARLYVIFKTGFGLWNIGSLNYVWANKRQRGQHWPNAYTKKVTMLAVESGSDYRGQWRSYKRNVAQDIKHFSGKDINRLKTIAIMTDSDNSKSSAKSYYGDIWFSAE